jgi:tRNA pseudouridine55 synthase
MSSAVERSEKEGFVNFLKPAGMSSHDAVDFFRWISGIRRVGHTGTLDPMAVGVLPLCVGKATRIAEYLVADRKRYRCDMRLGLVTDTQDIWGRVISEAESGFTAHLSERLIRETAPFFVGLQMQTPPMYSAVKVNGRRLYEYARADESVDVSPRKIKIYSIEIKRIDLARGIVIFDAECSKGTYMRTICHDWGYMLGCGAAMSGLIRLSSGMFTLEDAYTIEELRAVFSSGASFDHILTPMDVPLRDFPIVRLSAERGSAFSNGKRIRPSAYNFLAQRAAGTRALCRVYGDTGRGGFVFLGVGKFESKMLCVHKVFRQI